MDRNELNAALAVELFGWEHVEVLPYVSRGRDPNKAYGATDTDAIPDYLTGDGMLLVLEKMREAQAHVEMVTGSSAWEVSIEGETVDPRPPIWVSGSADNKHLPTAVAEAALDLVRHRAALAAKRKEASSDDD